MSRSSVLLLAYLVIATAPEVAQAGVIPAGDGQEADEAGRVLRLQQTSVSLFLLRWEGRPGRSLSDALEAQQGDGSRSFDPYWIVEDPLDARGEYEEYYSRSALEQSGSAVGIPEPAALTLLGMALVSLVGLRRRPRGQRQKR